MILLKYFIEAVFKDETTTPLYRDVGVYFQYPILRKRDP